VAVSIAFRLLRQSRHNEQEDIFEFDRGCLHCLSASSSVATRRRWCTTPPTMPGSPLPFGFFVSRDPTVTTKPMAAASGSPLPFGFFVSRDLAADAINPAAERAASPLPFGFFVSRDPPPHGWPRSLRGWVSIAFRLLRQSRLNSTQLNRKDHDGVSIAFRLLRQSRPCCVRGPLQAGQVVSIAFRLLRQSRHKRKCFNCRGTGKSPLPFGFFVSRDKRRALFSSHD